MSVDEVEPIEAEAAEENAVATRGTHLASTQTVTHEYLTQSGKVMRETVKTNQTVTAVLDFIYDESGKPFAMIDQLGASPKTYYYVLNLQGDVVKLIDQDGAEVAAYTYDAWGNLLSASGSMADVNPLRYRGYYYDSETGFYYLQSRYYDPATRRFINADSYASTGQGFVGTNMFAYCNGSPVLSSDSGGQYSLTVSYTVSDGRSHNDINYSRAKAVAYARKYWDKRNPVYPDYTDEGGDCTNFASQIMYEAGVQQSDEWYIKERWGSTFFSLFDENYKWKASRSWTLASANFSYVTGTLGRSYQKATSYKDIYSIATSNTVRAGDLIYFEREDGISHAAVITDVSNREIHYTQHSRNKLDKPLTGMHTYTAIYIVNMGD